MHSSTYSGKIVSPGNIFSAFWIVLHPPLTAASTKRVLHYHQTYIIGVYPPYANEVSVGFSWFIDESEMSLSSFLMSLKLKVVLVLPYAKNNPKLARFVKDKMCCIPYVKTKSSQILAYAFLLIPLSIMHCKVIDLRIFSMGTSKGIKFSMYSMISLSLYKTHFCCMISSFWKPIVLISYIKIEFSCKSTLKIMLRFLRNSLSDWILFVAWAF